jgi:hypothetical protein
MYPFFTIKKHLLLPSLGINYYRIKQVDFDEQSSYSDVVSMLYETYGGDVRIYPNPATSEVTIRSSHEANLEIMDI